MLFDDSRKAAFSATDVQYMIIAEILQPSKDQLNMENPRIYRRWEVFLVRRGFVETAPDLIERDCGCGLAKPAEPAGQIKPW